MTVGRVAKRAIEPSRTVAGTYDENPCLNMMIYEVKIPDGQLKEYAANVIAKNMLNQVDYGGFSSTMMEAITGYHKDEAPDVPKNNMYITTTSGQKRLKKTTVGWKLLVKWADGSDTCTLRSHTQLRRPSLLKHKAYRSR
jgi:hypothetical protein